MDSKQKKIAAVAVVVVIVIAAVAAYCLMNDKDKNSGDESTTYYYYLDGMGDYNGWYSGTGVDAAQALINATNSTDIGFTINSWGGIATDKFPAEGNMGFSVFLYTSTDVSSYYDGYFYAGPILEAVTSNIVYISYSEYTMDANYNVTYVLNPSTTTADLGTTGPFASGSGYKAMSYGTTYYFYLDGMGDYNGWYTGTGSNAAEAIIDATKNTDLNVTIGNWGQVVIEAFPAEGNMGISVYLYTSDNLTNYYDGYFYAGPVLEDAASNIFYLSYTEYSYDESYNITYELNPSTSTAATTIATTGPFAA
ncbi:MAG: hypothetical protein Q4Q62_02965 [Thermoplasmata archaeon]|nr:hypothetical protein [Thermoplasmata archaeon]